MELGEELAFEADDPRAEALSLDEQARAAGLMGPPERWHRTNGADWLAVQLQVGRGLPVAEVATRFGVSVDRIYARARKSKPPWPRVLSERDRRDLAKLVWFAGVERGALACATERARLMAQSEWRLARAPTPPEPWRARDAAGGMRAAAFDQHGGQWQDEGGWVGTGEGSGGAGGAGWREGAAYGPGDPQRQQRLAVRARVDALLAGLDAAGREADGADVAVEEAGERGGLAGPGTAGDDLAAVGEPGAAGAGGKLADVDADGRARGRQDAGGGGVGEIARSPCPMRTRRGA